MTARFGDGSQSEIFEADDTVINIRRSLLLLSFGKKTVSIKLATRVINILAITYFSPLYIIIILVHVLKDVQCPKY